MDNNADSRPPDSVEPTAERLRTALRRVVLLKETGPKSAAWHRARVRTIWHLHRLLDAQPAAADRTMEHRADS